MTDPRWRVISFNYRVPDDADLEDLEERMIDTVAEMIGCRCEKDSTECAAEWWATAANIDLDEDEETADSSFHNGDNGR